MGPLNSYMSYHVILAIFLIGVTASHQSRPRNTIFDDEKVKEGIFKNVEYFNDVARESVSLYRLPITTRPIHYDVLWAINMTDRSFTGKVDISLKATQANVNEIVLHATELNITSVELYQGDTEIYQTHSFQPAYNFLRVELTTGTLDYNATIPVVYNLSINFEAPLRTKMNGMYQSWFRNNYSDEESWMVATFFAPTYARYALPCYDEPSFKATFQVTVRRPTGYTTWAGTKLRDSRNSTDGTYVEDLFFTSPKMSTYILAIVVANFSRIGLDESSQVLHEIIARPGAVSQGEFAQQIGIDLVNAMNVYTGIDYYTVGPGLKMSHVAIPDFSAGAMENWGLLTYREALLMFDEQSSNNFYRQRIANIMSHEIAHMWFGNLVSCDWWSYMWLKEGFATFFQYYLTDDVAPYLDFPARFIVEQVQRALLSDSANNPHPLSNPNVGSPEEVSAMYTTISYNKGASIIRMTERLLGPKAFKEGIRKYLRNRYLDSAVPSHFFEALQEAADESDALTTYGPLFNVSDYYETWTEQGGHPVLGVEIDHSTGQMTLYQRRFNINSRYSTASRNWVIPITFVSADSPYFNDTKPSHIMTQSIEIINRTTIGDYWTIFNTQQTGFYRVNYDEYTWNLNIIALRSASSRRLIHEYNRAQIVDDVFQFARSGLMSYTRAFNIMSFLIYETQYAPWAAAISGFDWLFNRFAGRSIEKRLRGLFKRWATEVMLELTYVPTAGEAFSRTLLRYQLAPVMCRLEDPLCREAARHQFDEFRVNGSEVHADNRNWVYCNGLREGSADDFDAVWEKFITNNVYNEKIQILSVLGCTRNEAALLKFLDTIFKEKYVIRPQDYTTAFNSAVTGNRENTQIVFQYIKNNLLVVIEAFDSVTIPLSYISSRLTTTTEVEQFREWAISEQATLGSSYQAVLESAQTALDALLWADEVEEDIENYLSNGDDFVVPSTSTTSTTIPGETVTVPPLVEPSTPELDDSGDSADISYLSFSIILTCFAVTFMF